MTLGTSAGLPVRLITVPGLIEVDPVERGRKPVEVALAPHLAVRHDVDAGALLIANGNQRGVVLRLLENIGGDAPELPHPHARRGIRGEQRSVDQPLRLRIRADDRCRKQLSVHQRSILSWTLRCSMIREDHGRSADHPFGGCCAAVADRVEGASETNREASRVHGTLCLLYQKRRYWFTDTLAPSLNLPTAD